MKPNRWLSLSLPMLAVALAVLALGLFIEWPGWWNALFGVAGAVLLLAWALGFPRRRPR
jgi:Flp pilus assembly protein TadB